MTSDAKPTVSVVLCTHNPRLDFLRESLEALQAQTLPVSDWELLVVDNASTPSVSQAIDISWHPRAQVVPESLLGLTRARLRGIAVSVADILVFVDDDNLLDPDYLENVIQVSRDFPRLGAWGGQQRARCEVEPAAWVKALYFHHLAIVQVDAPRWTNVPYHFEATPVGAGLCVRRPVAEKYAAVVADSEIRRRLDRTGASLTGCGDHDLAFTACDMGLGVGVFPQLRLTHLMTAGRFGEPYLLKLVEGTGYSAAMLRYCRDGIVASESQSLAARALGWLQLCRLEPRERRKVAAYARGRRRAAMELRAIQQSDSAGRSTRSNPPLTRADRPKA